MRRLGRLAATLVAATASFGLTTCGCDDCHHHHDDGILEIKNDATSTDTVDHVVIDEVNGPDHFEQTTNLAPGESFFIHLFPDTYDVTIFWGDTTSEFHELDVFDNEVTTLTVAK